MYIPVVLGTGREGRQSEKIAHYIFEKVHALGIDTELVDVRDYVGGATITPETESKIVAPWRAIARRADAFLLVFPEYNHSYPGELKVLLDSAKKEYWYKPVALCSVSSGNFGGVRAADHLLPVLRELRMTSIKESLIFPNVEALVVKSGEELDVMYSKKIVDSVEVLRKYAEALKSLQTV